MYKNTNRYFWLFLALLFLVPATNIYADGSKDLYPDGALGRRAYLTSYYTSYSGSLPFQSYGTHYVYAKANETIALASSAWTGDATIKLFRPNGSEITTLDRANNAGRISTRAQELAGPKLTSTDNTTNRYLPIYYTVPAGGEGIYKVEFWSKTTTEMISTTGLVNTMADALWNSWNSSNTKSTHIGAWDVSVINTAKNGYIKGRVYANLLNMRIEGSSSASQGFYGKMYVLTKDGYTYRVDNNGNNGILFAFFVNNNGFVKGKQSNGSIDYTPLYKSLKTVDEAVNDNKIWDPTGPDNEQNITHKMFYTLPSEDLPKDTPVNGAVPGGSTWLKNSVVVPRVMDVRIQGADNTEGQVSTKGGYIKFNTESQGAYTIKIESNGTPSFATRYLYGTAVAGENSVYWDGKDGNLTPIPAGTAPASITVQLQGAEVHFPYFDMENNINGIKLELLDHELLPSQEVVKSDIVYWNDADIPSASNGVASNPKNNSHLPSSLGGVGSSGISSNSNGHKWGGGGTTGTFGDVKSMDTWTFIKGEEETIDTNVAIKIADLEVKSVTTFESGTTTPKDDFIVGDQLDYKVVVKNNGPSDVEEAPFTFRLPPGFEPTDDPVFSGNGCGTESIAMEYDPVTHTYRSKLNLPDGCEITYTFKAKVTGNSDPDDTDAVAGILRPNDVTDPNATNSSDPEKDMYPLPQGRTWDDLWKYPADWPDANGVVNYYVPPFSAEFECTHSNSTDPCNNSKKKTVEVTRMSDLAILKEVNRMDPDVGDIVTFTLAISNKGPHDAVNIIVTDTLPNGYLIETINGDGVANGNIIEWEIPELGKNDTPVSLSFTAKVLASGDYTNVAAVIGEGYDPVLENNRSSVTVVPCIGENIFIEDFGISDPNINHGRRESEYMPSGSFSFGTSKDNTNDYYISHIDNNHYAVVAPGYIKKGTVDGYYFWTPAVGEPNTVTDRSGTENGAVMVINAGETLNSFYDRPALLKAGSGYRASFWLYLVNGPSQVAIDIKHSQTKEVLATLTSPNLWDWDPTYKGKWTLFELYFVVPGGEGPDCNASNVVLSFRNNKAEYQGNDYFIDDIRLDKTCSIPSDAPTIECPTESSKNYWIGGKPGAPNAWNEEENWTAGFVPGINEDVVFATKDNNGEGGDGNGEGAAKDHLYLDDADDDNSGGRIIGRLENNSNMDLVITSGNQLTINGKVEEKTEQSDGSYGTGTILVKSTTIPTDGSQPVNAPTGTLKINPEENPDGVQAVVEFYNQAYDCADCGFYTRSWQYFGTPVDGSDFPFQSPVSESVNRWEEPVNGNKWVSVTSGNLIPFRGYQITNTGTTQPDHIYDFAGTLNVGDKDVALTRTTTPVVVNYAGANLVANSYTAAIPIKPEAMTFTNAEATVYLFNTGTRDEWRKLNGTAINKQGYRAGQYLAVPVNLGGTLHFPDRIPSMHSFMVLVDDATTTGKVAIKYDQLTKNTKVALGDGSTEIVTRSAESKSASSIPSLVMDVIGEQSADRIWIFTKEGTTNGFDNGWDGRKMAESGIVQFYVADEADKDHFQVATVPGLDNLPLGFEADVDGEYTIEFALSDHWANEEIYLNDLASGTQTRITNGGSYRFAAKKGDSSTRFSLSSSGGILTGGEAAKITVSSIDAGKIAIHNRSDNDCSVFISNTAGKLLKRLEVVAGDEQTVEDMPGGTHVVRLQNAVINDARKIVVR
ncbi:DUF11 domain-containing protein [Proteiniphilum sp.]|uniref:DUF11 domain-containing protein n=1 Tax=Proteiniphilum sp. TaxID=1926877 RepID=UPI00331E24A1